MRELAERVSRLRGVPAAIGCLALGLFAAKWIGEVLPDPFAVGLALFPAGFVAGVLSIRLGKRR